MPEDHGPDEASLPPGATLQPGDMDEDEKQKECRQIRGARSRGGVSTQPAATRNPEKAGKDADAAGPREERLPRDANLVTAGFGGHYQRKDPHETKEQSSEGPH
ncbi:hypothetical protein GBAR_LOCUS557 [Geodia barretti]|uniref:Uncharacterized protein n=1 Tax=Geodia barretti TaxID=519541 RepID=A0AA35QTH4_GEOBA|nr:hypothetical protein GBAR_LOCUS557 [Geodia barretti]